MKAIFKTAGIVLAAGTTLASCGSLSSSKSHRVHEPKPDQNITMDYHLGVYLPPAV